MSIGLYDADFRRYIHVPLNLDLMKLASYYKKHNEIVVLTPTIQDERHERTILRKDYDDGLFLNNPSQYQGLEMGGLAYSNGLYVPMNLEIERMPADTSIYNRVRDLFCTTKKYERAFNLMLEAEHCRLSLDNKTVWNEFSKQLRSLRSVYCVMFHDPNLCDIEGSFEIIQNITKMMKRSVCGKLVGSKFPIHVHNEDELLKWSVFKNTAMFYTMKFDGIMNDEAMEEFILKTQGRTISDQLIYDFTAGEATASDWFLQEGMCRIFKQIVFLRTHRRKIRLIYNNDFFPDPRWERLIEFWQCFTNQAVQMEIYDYDSLFKFARSLVEEKKYRKHVFDIQEARELFKFVQENNYELFKLFYECGKVRLEGGCFKNDRSCNSRTNY